MFKYRLGIDDTFLILAPRGSDPGPSWQIPLLAMLLLVPVGLIVWLGRYVLRLIPRVHVGGLLMLRLVSLLVLWLAVALQPHLAAVHVEETPGRVRIAVDLSTSMDVTDAQHDYSRQEAVRRILAADGMNLLGRLAERHQIEFVGFHQQLVENSVREFLSTRGASRPPIVATDLGLPLANVSAGGERQLLGIVLFSDGQHNVGTPPFDRADELGKQRVPIFPVVIGPREPPSDLMILDVQAPTKVFKDADIAVEIRCKATNLPAQELTVEMQLEGKPVRPEHRQVIQHSGKDDVFTIRFQAKMDEVGTHLLQIKATSKEGKEITLANNLATRIIRVGDEKARVLLIDGDARWEYHYLANALLRDRTVALERVVFSQPRIGAIKDELLDAAGLPKTKLPEAKGVDPLLDYDCILLGDVAPERLPLADRKRLERYVAERGGTLILIAGKRSMPLEYVQADKAGADPLVKMLPITEAQVLQKETGFALRVTAEGRSRPFLQLEPDKPTASWPDLPKHHWGVVGKRKPAAAVLLEVMEGKEDAGVLLQQNYGFGRVLFMGLDSTWRWRYRVGDTYHHRFWGQLVRWAAADRMLPAGNHLVRFGTREPVYAQGQEVELAVRRAADTVPPIKDAAGAKAKLLRRNADGGEELVAVVPLAVNPRQTNVLDAKVRDLAPGTYRIELDIPPYRAALATPSEEKTPQAKDRDRFRVVPRDNPELLDLAANWTLMQSLAERSGGKLYTPENVEDVLERLARRVERKEHRDESKPWQDEPMVWWLLGTLLALLSGEWVWRKCLELP